MSTTVINNKTIGLPTREELVAMRIWDLHFHGVHEIEALLPYIERMGIERLFSLDIGGWRRGYEEVGEARVNDDLALLETWRDLVSGIIRIDPSAPEASVAHMNHWVANGPCVGIKYVGGNPGGITCDHPNNDPIIERAAELGAVIYIHTWIKVGGEPRYPGGGNNHGESTPMTVAKLAARFPQVPLICGHAGGDWELGARAVRPHENVYFEFSGGDPFSGSVDFAVKELGVERIVWGGHIPSRCYSTELAKVYDADLTQDQRRLVLGGNLRRIAKSIMGRKGFEVE